MSGFLWGDSLFGGPDSFGGEGGGDDGGGGDVAWFGVATVNVSGTGTWTIHEDWAGDADILVGGVSRMFIVRPFPMSGEADIEIGGEAAMAIAVSVHYTGEADISVDGEARILVLLPQSVGFVPV